MSFPKKSLRPLSFVLILLVSGSLPVLSQGYLKASGKKIVDQKGNNVLLRGIGLGGWMLQEGYMLRVQGSGQQQHRVRERIDSLIGPEKTAAFYDAWLNNHTTKGDIDSLRSWGFNSIRLPMHYNLYTLPVEKEPVAGANTWIDKGFQLTDALLSWCKANKIYLILDLHAAPGGQGNDLNISDRDPSKPALWESDANKQKTVALWKKLAGRYKDEPWIGGYDIINEPNWGFTDPANDKNGTKEQHNEPLRTLMMNITAAIREVDKKHLIIIEGNGWGNNYNGVFPPWDPNMVLSFHKYWNKNDQASIKNMLAARDQYNIPIWLGETGENSNVWFTQAIRLFEENNIGWSWWPLKKLGFNNPLEIRSNAGYDKILQYWAGKGPRPSANEAADGVMQLAEATNIRHTIYHKDVIDAMFRQPFSNSTLPFQPAKKGKQIDVMAVDYDLGKNGVAYYDLDTADYRQPGQKGRGNLGRVYRNDGVDIRKEEGSEDQYYVSDFEAGEWLLYSIPAAGDGPYTIRMQVSSDTTGSLLSVRAGVHKEYVDIAVPNTGGRTGWKTIELKHLDFLHAEPQIKVAVQKGRLSFKSLELIRE